MKVNRKKIVPFINFRVVNVLVVLFTGMMVFGQEKEDIVGYWKSCDEGDNMVVKVQLDETNLPIGYLVGFQRDNGTWEENKPKKGLKVMYRFKYAGDLKWNQGKIYDPIADRTYRGVVKLQSMDTIKATGYWAFLWDDILFKRIKLERANEPKS